MSSGWKNRLKNTLGGICLGFAVLSFGELNATVPSLVIKQGTAKGELRIAADQIYFGSSSDLTQRLKSISDNVKLELGSSVSAIAAPATSATRKSVIVDGFLTKKGQLQNQNVPYQSGGGSGDRHFEAKAKASYKEIKVQPHNYSIQSLSDPIGLPETCDLILKGRGLFDKIVHFQNSECDIILPRNNHKVGIATSGELGGLNRFLGNPIDATLKKKLMANATPSLSKGANLENKPGIIAGQYVEYSKLKARDSAFDFSRSVVQPKNLGHSSVTGQKAVEVLKSSTRAGRLYTSLNHKEMPDIVTSRLGYDRTNKQRNLTSQNYSYEMTGELSLYKEECSTISPNRISDTLGKEEARPFVRQDMSSFNTEASQSPQCDIILPKVIRYMEKMVLSKRNESSDVGKKCIVFHSELIHQSVDSTYAGTKHRVAVGSYLTALHTPTLLTVKAGCKGELYTLRLKLKIAQATSIVPSQSKSHLTFFPSVPLS